MSPCSAAARAPSVPLALAMLGTLAVVLGPGVTPARAYERARVEGAPELGVYWAERALVVHLTPEIGDLARPELEAATSRSLATWSGAGGCTDVTLALGATALAARTNLDGGARDGENRIVFRRAWPAIIGPETIALTTYAYRSATGEILDADVDLDASRAVFSAAAGVPPPGTIDVENTLTHELGHLLGFAHVLDPEATLFAASEIGETRKRDLAADDVRAVCETYPRGAPTPPAGPLAPPPRASSCTAAPSVAPGVEVYAVLAWPAVLALARAGGPRRGCSTPSA